MNTVHFRLVTVDLHFTVLTVSIIYFVCIDNSVSLSKVLLLCSYLSADFFVHEGQRSHLLTA